MGDLNQVVPVFEQARLATVSIQTLSAGNGTCQRSPANRRPEHPESQLAAADVELPGEALRTARNPLMPLRIFSSRNVTGANLVAPRPRPCLWSCLSEASVPGQPASVGQCEPVR